MSLLARTLILRAGPPLYLHHKFSYSLAIALVALCLRCPVHLKLEIG